jgi:hypothetical protein
LVRHLPYYIEKEYLGQYITVADLSKTGVPATGAALAYTGGC